jgi:hypothetical protein
LPEHAQPAWQGALQSKVPPQPSPILPPQYCPPVGLQVSGVQLVGTHWLFTHVSPAMQSAQFMLSPQLLPIIPQYLPDPEPHATGAHAVPPLHRWSWQVHPAVVQSPQVIVPPQPSPSTPPQYCPPVGLQVAATHTAGTH